MRDAYLSSAGLALRDNRKERWSGQRAEAGRDPDLPQSLSGVQGLPKGFRHPIGHVISYSHSTRCHSEPICSPLAAFLCTREGRAGLISIPAHPDLDAVAITGDGALSRKPGRKPAAYPIGCRDGPALLPPPSLPARDHPARDLALSPLHLELPRCRGTAGRTRARHFPTKRSGDARFEPSVPFWLGAFTRSKRRCQVRSG